MALAHRITAGISRRTDGFGSGQYGAPRGSGTHHGLDVVARAGEDVMSPIDGVVVREALPYANDPSYRGILIRGTGEWSGIEVKMFYVIGRKSGQVAAGEVVGTAQDISMKYPGITNHVHLEVRQDGIEVPPFTIFGMCY